jgi:5-methyltetrahydropteroyltriglutamate--homocysteine methyltransferase
MKRSTDRILVTHTGSLPRPASLNELLRQIDNGEVVDDTDGFRDQVREAVAAIVARQVTAGVSVVGDGEMSKIGYSTYVKERLRGFGGEDVGLEFPHPDLVDFPEYMVPVMSKLSFRMPACVGEIAYTGLADAQTDIDNLRAAVDGAEVADAFMTAASPGVIAVFLANRHYRSHEEYVFALADAMKAEYDLIHQAGFVLQVDCPDLAMARHTWGDGSIGEFRDRIHHHVEAINHATRDIPPERMRLHLCWGNYNGPHRHDVALREIIDIALRARPAALSFEAANPRHEHEWKVFEETALPDGKILIPGVIDSTTNYVEHPELVAQRIGRYAELVGRENVIAGTDCGFATFADMVHVDPAITWAKLEAMAQGAALASAELW